MVAWMVEGRPISKAAHGETNIGGLAARRIIGLLHVGVVKVEVTGGITRPGPEPRTSSGARRKPVFQRVGSPES